MIKQLSSWVARILPKSGFARGVGVLAGGTALGQALVIFASPILTRLYSPDDFGALAVFASLLGIVAVIASLRYEVAIPLPGNRTEAVNTLVLALIVVLATSSICAAAVILLAKPIVSWTSTPAIEPYLWLLPIGVLLAGFYQSLNYWAVREGAFGIIAKTKLAQGASSILTQVGLGLLAVGPVGLLVGQIAGRAAGSTTIASHTLRSSGKALKGVTLAGITAMMLRYRRFPLYSTWSALANTLSSQIAPLLLAFYFGPAVTGLYALGLRVLQTPMNLLGSSIGQVFFSRAASSHRDGQLEELVISVFGTLVRIAVPVFAVIALTAPELFTIAFGVAWREAGTYVQWFSPWLLLRFVSSPLSTLPLVLERQGVEFVSTASLLTTRVTALIVGGLLGDANLTIALYALTSALCYFFIMLWNLSIAGVVPRRALGRFMRASISNVYILLPLLLGKAFSFATHYDAFVMIGASISGLLTLYAIFHQLREKS